VKIRAGDLETDGPGAWWWQVVDEALRSRRSGHDRSATSWS